MRNEKEMMDLILGVAERDERIRAVYMNGSRTNPNVPKDIFQDYDIVYLVTEAASFVKDEKWINVFGQLLMLQEPDKNNCANGAGMNFDRSYGYLMLFQDGNRIDLRIETKDLAIDRYLSDKLTIPLLDKDGCLPTIPASTDIGYHVTRPTEAQFMSNCNDFWWCLQNVAKGIWRDELPYAKKMFEYTTREQLDEMISWWIGMKHDFQVSTGKMGKYFNNFLPAAYWDMYQATYSGSSYEQMWDSIFVTCELFRTLATEVAGTMSFTYPHIDDANMTGYLKHVRNLPLDAEGVY
ncbi:aminoglycoside 6-adenylyltransferase [Paenibacillus sp. MMS18-CY102]|uniref:aminoglycoside 6-adenylyltransferase n=1 Tax=Paenibacillus sp. MMS18-CY102 TaxID=2682849 RepID=UPI001365676D|nr:aminoglycoside 6-adenylyltransferase [Paenibacillus sp. MMS18-CY102]MWC27678.1 aminoglycoside 6-adenylyltransferase [Paenibacillus sp. MMS18-CY102]